MTLQAQVLAPAAVLVLWSLLMLIWVAATRFRAMAKVGVNVKTAPPGVMAPRSTRVANEPSVSGSVRCPWRASAGTVVLMRPP